MQVKVREKEKDVVNKNKEDNSNEIDKKLLYTYPIVELSKASASTSSGLAQYETPLYVLIDFPFLHLCPDGLDFKVL